MRIILSFIFLLALCACCGGERLNGITCKDYNPWKLVWQDEFDGNQIDKSKWTHDINCWGGGNNELQCYTDRSKNSYVANGKLHLVAYREQWTGPDGPNGDGPLKTLPFTSARLHSKYKADFTYGMFCMRAKLPNDQGLWPAFWMFSTDSVYGGWSASGELDIMEAVNIPWRSEEKAEVHGTLWFGKVSPNQISRGRTYTFPTGSNPSFSFNKYCAVWEEYAIHWYVNDIHYQTITADSWWTEGSNDIRAPYDQNFHMIINLAVGGNWPGPPHEHVPFPKEYIIDFIRVYKR